LKKLKCNLGEKIKLLAACPIFSALDHDAEKLIANASCLREYKAGEFLFNHNEKADGFFAIVSGEVKVFRLSPAGKEQVLHLFSGGELVGEVPVFEGSKYPANAVANKITKAIYIDGGKFIEAGEEHPQLLFEMLSILSRRLRSFVGIIEDLSLKEVSGRLAKFLLDMSVKSNSNEFELSLKKNILASRLGTIAETLSRTIAKMQKVKLIEITGKSVKILDREGLIAIAAGKKL
jgi:CRP/FNR family transcriptional regulator